MYVHKRIKSYTKKSLIPIFEDPKISLSFQEQSSENEILYFFCKDIKNINNKDQCNWTPLYRSIISGDIKATEILLKNGADPNIKCAMDETPLYEAAELEKIQHVKLLLKNGADPNLQQIDGFTPLHIAVKKQNLNIIKLLLKYKADPNKMSFLYKQTPMHLAVKNNVNSKILLILVNYGGSLILKDKFNKKPIDYIDDDTKKKISTSNIELKTINYEKINKKLPFDDNYNFLPNIKYNTTNFNKNNNNNEHKIIFNTDFSKNNNINNDDFDSIKKIKKDILEQPSSHTSSTKFLFTTETINNIDNKKFIISTSPKNNKKQKIINSFSIKRINESKNSKKIIKNKKFQSLKILNKVHNSRNTNISKLFESQNSILFLTNYKNNDSKKNLEIKKVYSKPKIENDKLKKNSTKKQYKKIKNYFNKKSQNILTTTNKIPLNKKDKSKNLTNVFITDNNNNSKEKVNLSNILFLNSSTSSTQKTFYESYRNRTTYFTTSTNNNKNNLNNETQPNKNYLQHPIYYWLKEIKLLVYLPLFLSKKIFSFQEIINGLKSKLTITPNDIKNIGIKVPGHIYRIIVKLEIDSGLINKKYVNFILGDNKNINAISFDYLENPSYECCGYCKPSNKKKIILKKKNINFIEEKYDLNDWLSSISMGNYINNFIENGFDLFEYILLQMFSSVPLDFNIIKNEIGINDSDDIDIILLQINKKIKEIMKMSLNKNRSASQEVGNIRKNESIEKNQAIENSNCLIF